MGNEFGNKTPIISATDIILKHLGKKKSGEVPLQNMFPKKAS